jgi:hypothetical protein
MIDKTPRNNFLYTMVDLFYELKLMGAATYLITTKKPIDDDLLELSLFNEAWVVHYKINPSQTFENESLIVLAYTNQLTQTQINSIQVDQVSLVEDYLNALDLIMSKINFDLLNVREHSLI